MTDELIELSKKLEQADKHAQADEDNAALRIYEEILQRLTFPKTPDEEELFECTAAGLMSLRNSNNEFIYESCVKLLDTYLDWIEMRDAQQEK